MTDFDFLQQLVSLHAGPGDETRLTDFLRCEMEAMGYFCETTPLGSLLARPEKTAENRCDILFDAHVDQICLMATEVLEGGFVRCAPSGGVDPRSIQGQPVVIYGSGENGRKVSAVTGSVPPHLSGKEDKLPPAEDIVIDTGIDQGLKKLLRNGDRIYFDLPLKPLANELVCGPGLDNKAGILCLLKLAKELMKNKKAKKAAFLFSTREETGGAGAATAAFSVSPKCAVSVDVSFARTPGARPEKTGKMGAGPMIGMSPVLSRRLSVRLAELAREKDISFQTEIMPERTSTNADGISLAGAGVPSALVSIPLKYMHSPCEVISMEDLCETSKLLSGFAETEFA